MRVWLTGLLLIGLAGCGAVQPDHGSGAAAAPTTAGGLAGPQEGNPNNARNLGTDSSTTIAK